MTVLAARTADTVTFHAVELFKQATALQRRGIDIISLGVGEPDFTAAPQVIQAMQLAAQSGKGGYSPPLVCPNSEKPLLGFIPNNLAPKSTLTESSWHRAQAARCCWQQWHWSTPATKF